MKKKKLKFAIDLTGIKRIESGIGYYVFNLLKGMGEQEENFELLLIVGEKNKNLFSEFKKKKMDLLVTNCDIESKVKRTIWINLYLSKILSEKGINICIEPYYCMPVINVQGIKYVTTIHDLLAYHYPEFQTWGQNLWLHFMWNLVVKKAKCIVTISEFCRNDIIEHFPASSDKVKVIYNAAIAEDPEDDIFEKLKEKYHIVENEYYYTVSKIRPNKNLTTLVKVISEMKKDNYFLNPKLLVSGSNGGEAEKIQQLAKELNIEDCIILTGFVSDEERNALYKYAKAFLFPSVFEGFGMPVIEAMSLGTMVLTTKCTSLYEVTQGKANYVENPYSVSEWVELLKSAKNQSCELNKDVYTKKKFALNFLELLSSLEDE